MDAASFVALVLLLVVFQPELGRALLHLDLSLRRRPPGIAGVTPALVSICDAVFALANMGRGALVVLVRQDPVDALVSGGVPLGGTVSKEILEAIFRKVSPVHDGATIVERDRISRVGAILPLTERMDLLSEFGTRHRAAFGLAERCDAAVIVVSKERGVVTLVHGHQQQVLASIENLAQALQSLGVAQGSSPVRGLRRNVGFKMAALAVAILLWVGSFEAPGATVRNVMVPIEFTNVPDGMEVRLSPDSITLQVQLRGTSSKPFKWNCSGTEEPR